MTQIRSGSARLRNHRQRPAGEEQAAAALPALRHVLLPDLHGGDDRHHRCGREPRRRRVSPGWCSSGSSSSCLTPCRSPSSARRSRRKAAPTSGPGWRSAARWPPSTRSSTGSPTRSGSAGRSPSSRSPRSRSSSGRWAAPGSTSYAVAFIWFTDRGGHRVPAVRQVGADARCLGARGECSPSSCSQSSCTRPSTGCTASGGHSFLAHLRDLHRRGTGADFQLRRPWRCPRRRARR